MSGAGRLSFATSELHRAWLRSQSALPRGFKVGTSSLTFKSPTSGKPLAMRLTALVCEKATPSFAAVLTRNQVAGAPIIVARRRLAESTLLSGVVVNNRVANVVAPNGVSDAERVCEAAAKALGVYSGEGMISLSTGVVGWPLPVDAMVENMPALAESVKANKLDALDAAASIMTTDQWPKVRRAALPGGASVVGIAKGAGMVEPNMATMLSVLLTDARVSRSTLQRALERAVNAPGSFNSCSVDSDTSTSDAVVVLASNMQGVRFVDNTASNADESAAGDDDESAGVADSVDTLAAALTEVCRGLAEDVVRNGEGVSHVLRVRVANAPTDELAHAVGKAIVNSPLIKCAVAADDANIGRVAMAIGKAAMHHNVALTLSQVRIAIGGLTVLEQGALIASPELDTRLQQHMAKARMSFEAPPPVRWPVHNGCVEIDVDLGTQGSGTAEIIGADLTHEYVSINADYRT